MENDTWQRVPPPEDKNIVGSRWVFKVKRSTYGLVDKFKARLVVQEYSQAKGIDYQEVFSPAVQSTSIRSLLALANTLDWEIHQMDVKTAFLQGDLTEEIYMEQPEGYRSEEHPDYVFRLKKSLYGLKQSASCGMTLGCRFIINSARSVLPSFFWSWAKASSSVHILIGSWIIFKTCEDLSLFLHF